LIAASAGRRLLACLALAAAAPQLALADEIAGLVQRYASSVVPVRFTLRPREAPEGSEGRKVEDVVCGLLVGDEGMVVISGDPFPDPGGDPRATLDPVAFAVLEPGERELPATVLGLNPDLNLAYLRLDGGLPAGRRGVAFDGDAEVRIGEEVVVIGLLPKRYGYAPTFWTGQVSAVLDQPRRMYGVTIYVQDLAIGGLAATAGGKPLGIVAEDVQPTPAGGDLPSNPLALLGSMSQGPKVGYPMIFPPSLFRDDLASPPAFVPEPQRAWLGITMQPLSRALGDYWKIDNPGGIIVSSVLDGSPAQGAGLAPGDIILALGGRPVTAREQTDLDDFRQAVEKLPMGQEVSLTVWRAGERMSMGILPGVRPRLGFLAEEYEAPDFGLTVREITIDIIQGQNLAPDVQGVVVSELESAGWAQVSGIFVGDLILRVDDATVTGLESFQAALNAARERHPPQVYFFLQRGVETLFVAVRTDW
jgi:serine protease Do